MKKTTILLVGIMLTPMIAFAGGYGLLSPLKLESKATTPTADTIIRKVIKKTNCTDYERNSRWYECDTKSVLRSRRSLMSERFSDSQAPTAANRETRGQDIEREFDRQAAARNKLLRYRRAYGR